MPIEILVTDTFNSSALSLLQSEIPCRISSLNEGEHRPDSEQLTNTEVLLIRSKTKIDGKLLAVAPKLKLIVSATSGFDHIDLELCQKNKIIASYTPNANSASAAELTLGLLLCLARNFPKTHRAVQKFSWRQQWMRGQCLEGKILGLVGLGRIGQRVARAAHGLGMQIWAYDPFVEETVFHQLHVHRSGFTELLIASDVVSLHVPLTKKTQHMMNYQTLRIMNPEAWLINTSRGAVVDEDELAEVLKQRKIQGAALDVFEQEPLAQDSALRTCENVILTPHLGAFTEQALTQASFEAVAKVVDYYKKNKIMDTLPIQASWYKEQ
ncbi:MAG: phosphoglycerate dehydrogenase [Bdellovibrionales bacterium]|nr:phosphoglycerate dehydrogenase [Bdellovibrionales bacterium]